MSWQVRLAAALVWLGLLPALVCFRTGVALLDDNDLLFVLTPIIMCAVWGAGLVLAGATTALAMELQTRSRGARLHVLLLGVSGLVVGVMTTTVEVPVGLGIAAWGAALVWLMWSRGAEADLGDWLGGTRVMAPWGGTPGTGPWSKEPTQQGPWSPDPTALPWLSWRGHSGPRPPWWRTWQAGLELGLPVWEVVVLAVSLLLLGAGLAAVGTGDAEWLLLLVPAVGGVLVVEQRLRRRLARQRD